MAQIIRNPPAIPEIWIQTLEKENPLKKGMAITPVFLPGKFHGQRSLAGYSPWGHKESDMTECLTYFSIIRVILNMLASIEMGRR